MEEFALRSTIKALAAFAVCTIIPAIAAPPADLPIPKFRKGIWATQHYQEINGRQPRQSPEHVLDKCVDPAENLRKSLLSGQRDGCEIKVEAQTEREISYSSTCPSGSLRRTVQSPAPTEYTITTTFKLGRDVQTGHWLRDCPTFAELPLPDIKKGVWSVTIQPDLLSPQKTERTVALCRDSTSVVRDELTAAESEGCSVESWNRGEHGLSVRGQCKGPGNFSLAVSFPSVDELQILAILGDRSKGITGKRLKDCSASDAPLEPRRQN